MKTLRFLLGVALVAVTFSLEQCAKGDPGAPGSQGPTGLTGPTGPTWGTSQEFASQPADWSPVTSTGGYNFLLAAYTDSAINANAVNNGVVAVYVETDTISATWAPLPWTYPISTTTGVTQTMTYSYNAGTVGNLVLEFQNSNNSTPATPLGPTYIKAVEIPTAIMKQHPGLNVRDYASVMQVLNRNKNL